MATPRRPSSGSSSTTRSPSGRPSTQLAKYPGAELVWVQDEPRNQGAWPLMAQWLHEDLCDLGETRPWRVVARKAAASPATGSSKKHAVEQAELMERAFGR